MHKTSSCAPIILSAGLLAAWPAIAGAPKGDAAQNAAVAARVIDANVLAQVVPGISLDKLLVTAKLFVVSAH